MQQGKTVFLKALYYKTIHDHFRGIAGWILGVTALVVIQLAVYPTIRASSEGWSALTDSFPDAIKEILRMTDYTTEVGYLSAELLSFVLPFIFIGLGCTWGSRLTTEDEEGGAADILFSLPVARSSLLLTRVLTATTVLASTSFAFVLTLSIGARILEMSISLWKFIAAALVLFFLSLLMMSLAGVLGAVTGKRSISLGVSMSFAIATFVFYSLAPLVSAFESLLSFNPMQWTIGTDPLQSGLDIGYTIWIVLVSGFLFIGTFAIFNRRDITT